MSQILIVGGAGYVGAVLTRELLERGYAVRVADRLYFGDAGLRDIRDRIDLVVADMRALPPEAFRDVDAVVNVAGLSNDPTAEYNPTANHEMNTVATVRLAEQCRQAGVQRYVFASSCSIYDRGVTDEDRDVVLDETAEVRPRAAYATSKHEAEQRLLAMAGPDFCPVILRKGTIYGFSPRMRYDLVVNTFVKDALAKGAMTIYCGGEMWRPLLDVRDAARAYIACIEAEPALVGGQIFNVAFQNVRISELALRVRTALRAMGVSVDVVPDYSYRGVRSYRVSARKIQQRLGFNAKVDIEEAVREMAISIRQYHYEDFDNPRYYNIRWVQFLEEAERTVAVTGSVFGAPAQPAPRPRVVAARTSDS
ncbi:MAG: SDR family oxidoreductase [Deltaproteobacteria bacterium]|nr:SDR family oxidoreductase [Deltaproteobacteria bacterium]